MSPVAHRRSLSITCISQGHADEMITLCATHESRLCHFFATRVTWTYMEVMTRSGVFTQLEQQAIASARFNFYRINIGENYEIKIFSRLKTRARFYSCQTQSRRYDASVIAQHTSSRNYRASLSYPRDNCRGWRRTPIAAELATESCTISWTWANVWY